MNMWLPLVHPQLGPWPATQACALTGNGTGNPLVRRRALNPLSHTSQGCLFFLKNKLLSWLGGSIGCSVALSHTPNRLQAASLVRAYTSLVAGGWVVRLGGAVRIWEATS